MFPCAFVYLSSVISLTRYKIRETAVSVCLQFYMLALPICLFAYIEALSSQDVLVWYSICRPYLPPYSTTWCLSSISLQMSRAKERYSSKKQPCLTVLWDKFIRVLRSSTCSCVFLIYYCRRQLAVNLGLRLTIIAFPYLLLTLVIFARSNIILTKLGTARVMFNTYGCTYHRFILSNLIVEGYYNSRKQ